MDELLRTRAGGEGRGEPGLPPRMRPQDGLGGRLARWMWPRRKAARMLLQMLLRPDGFRGCLLLARLWGKKMSGVAAA